MPCLKINFIFVRTMYVLIGDSGSTKTDWAYISDGERKIFTTQGLNPNHLSEMDILHILKDELNPQANLQSIEKVAFYGAGLGNIKAKEFLTDIFRRVFKNAQKITVEHDVLGAAHALYTPNEQGIVCILGTGSIAGYFDGNEIVKTSGGLGYLLGDEGSGTYLGKLLIAQYAQGKLPHHLETALQTHIQVKSTEALHFLYKEPHPNRFMAQLTRFLYPLKKEETIKNILHTAFEDFYKYTLSYLRTLYPDCTTIRCVGSVAYLFQEELLSVMQKHNIQIDKVVQKPIQGLVESVLNTSKTK